MEQSIRILVVDDEPDIRRICRILLENGGYAVDEAATGLEAVRAVREHPDYDLILMDIMMPDLGGIDIRTSGAAYFLWYFDDDTCFVGLAGNPADGRFLRCPPGGYRLSLDHGNRYPLAELVPHEAEPGGEAHGVRPR